MRVSVGLRWRELAWVAALFVVLTVVMTAPLSLAPATRALALSADTRLFLWTISWDVHALLHGPASLFDANIFYPEPRTLAYSEHLLGSALLGAPALLASGNPVLALNVIVLLSCVLSGLGAYVLARQLRASVPAAILAGVVFAFAAPRFVRLAQLHLATVQYIPFALAFCHRYLDGGRRRDLLAALTLFTVQALTSGHGGLFLLLALAALSLYSAAWGRLPGLPRLLRDLGVAGALLLAVNVALFVPYLRAQRDVGLHRTLGAVYDWPTNWQSFLASPAHVQGWLLGLVPPLRDAVEHASAYLFPGWLALLLALVALLRRRPPAADADSTALPPGAESSAPPRGRPPLWLSVMDTLIVLAALVTLVIRVEDGIDWKLGTLSLTARSARRAFYALAALGVLRLALARRTAPWFLPALERARGTVRRVIEARLGFDAGYYVVVAGALRLGLPRSELLALQGAVPAAAGLRPDPRAVAAGRAGAARDGGTGGRRPRPPGGTPAGPRARAAGIVARGVVVGELAAFPVDARPYDVEAPAIDRELASRPRPFAAVELPVADPANAVPFARLNSRYMLHSMLHWQPIVNGYSGIVPPRHERLFRILTAFPDTASLAELEAIGVRYAVVHREFYTDAEWAGVVARAEGLASRLQLEAETDDGRLYSLPLARAMR